MENPWKEFADSIDYSNLVLKSEQNIIRDFNESLGPLDSDNYREYSIHTDIMPAPFMGEVYNSPIVLLTLNPGWDPKEAACGFYSKYSNDWLNMIQSPHVPLFCLDEDYIEYSPYWNYKLKPLIQLTSKDAVSKSISVVQFFPYQSKRFKPIGKRIYDGYLPSQRFNFELVKKAMERNAFIIILRSRKLWYDAVTGLEVYDLKCQINNPRNPVLSMKNLGANFEKVVNRLKK